MEIKIGKATEVEKQVTAVQESYSITALVKVNEGVFNSIGNGEVLNEKGESICYFTNYGSLAITFAISDTTTMATVLDMVNTFVEECKNNVKNIG